MSTKAQELIKIDNYVNNKSIVKPCISAKDLDILQSTTDQKIYRQKLRNVFKISEFAKNHHLKRDNETLDILIDLYENALLFTQDFNFSQIKTIVLLSIYDTMVKDAINQEFYEEERLYGKYKKLILQHSVERPPYSCGVFTLNDLKNIDEFFMNSYFRNVKNFMSIYSKQPYLSFISKCTKGVNPYILPPLAEMHIWVNGVEVIPPPPVEEKGKKSGRSTQKEKAKEKQLKEQKAKEEKERKAKEEAERLAKEKEEKEAALQAQLEQEQKEKEQEEGYSEPEDRGPDVPLEIIKESLDSMHNVFVTHFDETEQKLVAKIKELEIKVKDHPLPPPKKTGKKK